MSPRVVAVVVTWNRRDLLVESLAAIEAQTLKLTSTVVVDNASTDGTTDLLDSSYGHLEVVHLSSNHPPGPCASGKLQAETGSDASGIDFLPFSDLNQSVTDDVHRILDTPQLDDAIPVSGYIYDVHSGALELVVPAKTRATA